MKVTYVEMGLIGLVGITALLLRTPQHEVKYGVGGVAGSKYVVISYLDTPYYGYFKSVEQKDKVLKHIRVPATALPWSTTVYLPQGALAWAVVRNENKAKSHMAVSVKVDKSESISATRLPSVANENMEVVGKNLGS